MESIIYVNLLVFWIWQLELSDGQVFTMALSSVTLDWLQPINSSSGKRRRMSLTIDAFSSDGRHTAHSKAKAVTKTKSIVFNQTSEVSVTFCSERNAILWFLETCFYGTGGMKKSRKGSGWVGQMLVRLLMLQSTK